MVFFSWCALACCLSQPQVLVVLLQLLPALVVTFFILVGSFSWLVTQLYQVILMGVPLSGMNKSVYRKDQKHFFIFKLF